MAPLPPSSTKRYWLDYTTCLEPHSLQVRTHPDATPADVGATIAAFLTVLEPWLYQLDVTGFRMAELGSNISVPVTWPGDAQYGGGPGTHNFSAQFVDFVGRDSAGKRVRAAVFGCNVASSNGDYRITEAESTLITDAIDVLTSDGQIFLSISEYIPVWHRYANIGENAYWRNHIR